jgi:hypothetical protein
VPTPCPFSFMPLLARFSRILAIATRFTDASQIFTDVSRRRHYTRRASTSRHFAL